MLAPENSRVVGRWMRGAARRFLADLKHAAETKNPRFTFSAEWAIAACRFVELLPHVEGVWSTPTIVLHESHLFLVVQLFGFRNPSGGRRFTTVLFAVARKNAKSTLAAAIMLAVYCLEDEPGAQLMTAATTGSQARIVFNIAKAMVMKTPELAEHYSLAVFANSIANRRMLGSFKPINAKASSQDGHNPSAVCLDEIHAHKTTELRDVLASAAGARDDPLFLNTTTEGYDNPGPWHELRHFAIQVLEHGLEADHFLPLYYAIDDEDDDFDPETWKKANPLWDVNPKIGVELMKLMIDARAMPSTLAEFRIKRLNRASSSAKALINLNLWAQCGADLDLEWLAKHPCVAAVDLSSVDDLTALRFVWFIDGVFYTWGRRWVPAYGVTKRTQSGRHSYAGWVQAGLIEQTPGEVIDYATIEAAIRADFERFRPKQIAFDPWQARDLMNRLQTDGLPVVEFPPLVKHFHPAMQAIEVAYRTGQMVHGGDQVLRWCAANMVPRYDSHGNMAPDKRRSPDKIDDMVALYMAAALLIADDGNEGDMMDFLTNPVGAA